MSGNLGMIDHPGPSLQGKKPVHLRINLIGGAQLPKNFSRRVPIRGPLTL